jgi:hypothetical protein
MSEEKEEILTDPVSQIVCAKCGKPLDVAALAAFTKFRCGHCNAVQTVPAKLGNFILLELLGRGGMGAVYRGVDQALGRAVAIKVMLRSVAADKVFYEQFKREARAAAALSHPNIVQVYSLDEEKGQSYIVMELLSGGRLDHLISERKRLDEATVLRLAIEVAEGLHAANRAGLIHDDIKPENILFDSKGTAKIVDFGLARFRGKGPQAGQNEIWGTPYYIAPEKVLRKTPDFKSDIYSLGGTLFHALAGRPPFEGETAVDVVKARIQSPAPNVRTFRPEVRPEVGDLLARMLEREPEKRQASYLELITELRKLAGIEAPKTATGGIETVTAKGTKIVIKGKRKLTLSSPADGSGSAENGDTAGKQAKPKHKLWVVILIVLAGLFVLAGLGTGAVVMALHRKTKDFSLKQQAETVRLHGQAGALLASIQNNSTGVLAGAESLFFYDVEATNRLAQARAILTSMGDQAKLVTLPVLPSEKDVADRVTGPAIGIFTGLTNLEAICAEAVQIAAYVEAAGPAALPDIRAGVARLEAIDKEVPPLALAIGEAQKTGAKVAGEALEWIQKAGELRDAGSQAAAKESADAAALKKREAEEAEKKRLAAERAAKIEEERETIRAAWGENADRIRQNQFTDAADSLKKTLAKLATEEGKADAKAAVDRCLILQEMKDYLIAAIQDKPLRWGWFSAGGQIDITGANEKGILVRGKLEPWTVVDARQMLKFVDAYVKSEDAREKKGKRGWARLQLGAAIYCYLQGDKAYKLARIFADLAIQNDSKLEDEVKRLMPELPKGEA